MRGLCFVLPGVSLPIETGPHHHDRATNALSRRIPSVHRRHRIHKSALFRTKPNKDPGKSEEPRPPVIHSDFPEGGAWDSLLNEFEDRAARSGNAGQRTVTLQEQLGFSEDRFGQMNPEVHASMPYVESAFMSACLVMMWIVGRILKLDSFLILFYPMPVFLIAFRWGFQFAGYTVLAASFLMCTDMGLLYAISYILNTGLMTWAFAVTMALRFDWLIVLLAATAGKFVGLLLNIRLQSVFFKIHLWDFVRDEARNVCVAVMTAVAKAKATAAGGAAAAMAPVTISAPSAALINSIMLGLVLFASVYYAFFTYMTASILLDQISFMLRGKPTLMPFIYWLREQKLKAVQKHQERLRAQAGASAGPNPSTSKPATLK